MMAILGVALPFDIFASGDILANVGIKQTILNWPYARLFVAVISKGRNRGS